MKVDQLFRIETVDWTGGQIKVKISSAVEHGRIWFMGHGFLVPILPAAVTCMTR